MAKVRVIQDNSFPPCRTRILTENGLSGFKPRSWLVICQFSAALSVSSSTRSHASAGAQVKTAHNPRRETIAFMTVLSTFLDSLPVRCRRGTIRNRKFPRGTENDEGGPEDLNLHEHRPIPCEACCLQ